MYFFLGGTEAVCSRVPKCQPQDLISFFYLSQLVSMQLIFFLAMTKYQDVQHRAQDEIDAVVGNRLPTFEDLRNLPYVRAIMKETLRWRAVAPSSTCFLVSHTIWPRN